MKIFRVFAFTVFILLLIVGGGETGTLAASIADFQQSHAGGAAMSDVVRLEDTCSIQMPGDANGDGLVTSIDVTYLTSFLGLTGPPPEPLANGDADGDCDIDDDDVNYIAAYIYSGGPSPVECTCMLPVWGETVNLTIEETYDSAGVYNDGRVFEITGWFTDNEDGKLVASIEDFLQNQPMPPQSAILLDGVPLPEAFYESEVTLSGFIDSLAYDSLAYHADDTLNIYFHVIGYRLIGEALGKTGVHVPGMRDRSAPFEKAPQTDTCNYAILLSGGINDRNNHARYWNVLEDYFAYLEGRGFLRENIKVLYYDGVSDNQVAVPQLYVRSAVDSLLEQAVDEIATSIDQQCLSNTVTVWLWVFNHGESDGDICMLGSDVLTPQGLQDYVEDIFLEGVDSLFVTMGQCFGGNPALKLKDIDLYIGTRMFVTADAHPDVTSYSKSSSDPYLEDILDQLNAGRPFRSSMIAACSTYYEYLQELDSKGYSVNEHLGKRSIAWKRNRMNLPGDVAHLTGFPGGKFLCHFHNGGSNCGNTELYEKQAGSWVRVRIWNWNIPGSAYYQAGNDTRRYDIGTSSTGLFKAVCNSKYYLMTTSCIADTGLSWKSAPSIEDYAGFVVGWDDDSPLEFADLGATSHVATDINQVGFSLSNLPQQFGPLNATGVTNLSATFSFDEYNAYWDSTEIVLDVAVVLAPGMLHVSYFGQVMDAFIDTVGTYRLPLEIDEYMTSHMLEFDAATTCFLVDFWGVSSLVQTGEPMYMCGDANGDEAVNVGDAVFLINYVFKGGPPPNPMIAGDANCDIEVNIGDAVYIINYSFKGGPAPCAGC